MQRWEYCYVYGVRPKDNGFSTWYPNKRTFTSKESYIIAENLGKKNNHGVAETIAKLGEDGWEIVGAVPSNDFINFVTTLYFKRPIEEGSN